MATCPRTPGARRRQTSTLRSKIGLWPPVDGNRFPRKPCLDKFVEDIALLAAPASRQEEWLDEHHYPVVELALQYYDSYHAFAQRLAENGLLDTQDCRHLDKSWRST